MVIAGFGQEIDQQVLRLRLEGLGFGPLASRGQGRDAVASLHALSRVLAACLAMESRQALTLPIDSALELSGARQVPALQERPAIVCKRTFERSIMNCSHEFNCVGLD